MRLREQHKSNLAAAIQGITPLECVPICDKSHHPWKSCSCSTQQREVWGRGGEITSYQLKELENVHSASQRVNSYCVLPANGEPCGHLGALVGLCPDIMRVRSGFRSSSLPLCCRAPVAACQLLCYRKLRGGIKPWLPVSLKTW